MSIAGQTIAALVTDGFEQVELTGPMKALREAGATVMVVSPKSGEIQGMNHDQKADRIRVDKQLSGARPEAFDALLLPGGVANPDYLRVDPEAVAFVEHFVTTKKPIAAICHGPWSLIEADGVKGRRVTSWPSLRTDLSNAGATWLDEAVVRDGSLVTSRKPDDIPAFARAFVALLEETGRQEAPRRAS